MFPSCLRFLPLTYILSCGLYAQDTPPENPLRELPAYQAGIQALQDRLPQLAAERFAALLKYAKEDSEKADLNLLLAESYVRADQPKPALLHLKNVPKDIAIRNFWQAQAQSSDGQFSEAIKTFELFLKAEATDLHPQARLSLASLYRALGDSEAAIQSLAPLLQIKENTSARRKAALQSTSLHLNLEQTQLAAKALISVNDWKSDQSQADYLQGKLDLQRGRTEKAIRSFTKLIDKKDQLPASMVQSAEIGIILSHLKAKETAKGIAAISTFISSNPESIHLPLAFQALAALSEQDPQQKRVALERLNTWLPALLPQDSPFIFPLSEENAASPRLSERTQMTAREMHAMYYKAKLSPSDEAGNSEALKLLHRLRLTAPESPLSYAGLLETGLRAELLDKPDLAQASYETLSNSSASPRIRAMASFMLGSRIHYPVNPTASLVAFQIAAQAQSGIISQAAEENAALIMLAQNRLEGVGERIAELPKGEVKQALELELALVTSRKSPLLGAELLRVFIAQNPNHPRLAEAQLSLASSLSFGSAETLDEARKLISGLAENTSIDRGAYTLAAMKLAQQQLAFSEAKALAQSFLSTSPEHPAAPLVSMRLGQSHFQTRDYNEARITLERLGINESLPLKTRESALYFAALSAWQVGTPASREDSIKLLKDTVKLDGHLAASARKELAESLLSFGKYEDALTQLDLLTAAAEKGSESWLQALILTAEARLKLDGKKSDQIDQAIKTYDTALKADNLSLENRSRLSFLKGRALEESGDTKAALNSYYKVVNKELPEAKNRNNTLWIETCGFRILSILESEERWPAAIAIARKIAAVKGPKAEEAQQKAERLSLTHMIFDE